MSKKIKIGVINQLDILKSIRKDWGEFNPITRVKKDKKKYNRKQKYKRDLSLYFLFCFLSKLFISLPNYS
jgi:hypothetical protein